MNVLAFDIETVPDVEAGRRAHRLEGLDDEAVAKALVHMRVQETGRDFLPLHLHRVVAIAVVLRSRESLRVWSLGDPESSEPELIRRFFEGVERYTPTLVSWNGGGFDLPVLHYRSLRHGIAAGRYWETGADDPSFRFNNYLNRFHERHSDLMDVLAGYQARASVRLDDVALLLGLPGKMGMDGAQVWPRYLAGDIAGIRAYCETDALTTYLVYLRLELVRGRMARSRYDAECELARRVLGELGGGHWREFLAGWRPSEDVATPAGGDDGPQAAAAPG